MNLHGIVIPLLFLGLLVSFWNRNDLPENIRYLPALQNEPVQKPTAKSSFSAQYDGVSYEVEPEYEYDLYGMVVSFRHHDGESRMHSRSNDHLNMLDLCVIWGDNTENPHLDKIDFWNGIFTCNVKTRDQAAWDAFDMYQLSNNHLISDDTLIRDQVREVSIGDQVRIKGYLASYGADGRGKRGTSTTRLDTGDGACETIFVERFEIVAAATNYWRMSMYSFLGLLVAALVNYFARPYKPH